MHLTFRRAPLLSALLGASSLLTLGACGSSAGGPGPDGGGIAADAWGSEAAALTDAAMGDAQAALDGTPKATDTTPGPDLGPSTTYLVKAGQAIQPFVDQAQPGDTIVLEPGLYKPAAVAEAMVVILKEKDGLTIRGGGKSPEETILDGDHKVLHVIFIDEGIGRKTVVENLTVTGGYAYPKALFPSGLKPTLRPEISLEDDFYHDGAGFMIFRAGPTIRGCRSVANSAERCGGGVSVFAYASVDFPTVGPLLEGMVISDNVIGNGTGGGVDVYNGANATLVNTLISGNNGWGAVAVLDKSTASFENVTIVDSKSYAIAGSLSATLTIKHSIIAWSVDEALHFDSGTKIAVSHSCFWKNGDPPETPPGTALLTADPLFVPGPRGKYYLSQKSSGQAAESACVNAGSTTASALKLGGHTTRTDGAGDTGLVDLGYHYPQ